MTDRRHVWVIVGLTTVIAVSGCGAGDRRSAPSSTAEPVKSGTANAARKQVVTSAPARVEPNAAGPIHQVLSASTASAGQLITVTVEGLDNYGFEGTGPAGWQTGVYLTLETDEKGHWRTLEYLFTDVLGKPTDAALSPPPTVPAVLVFVHPVTIVVPRVAPGEYRLRQDISGGPAHQSITLSSRLGIT